MTPASSSPSRFSREALQSADHGEVQAQLNESGVRFLRLRYSDVFGRAWNVEVPLDRFGSALAGSIRFHGSISEGFVRPEQTDMFLSPDLTTLRVLPWGDPAARVALLICDVQRADGSPFEGDPRAALKRVLATVAEAGYQARIAAETEFLLLEGAGGSPDNAHGGLDNPLPPDVSRAEAARRDAIRALEDMGVAVEAAHPEAAPGQHEIDLHAGDPLTLADDLTTVQLVVHHIARQHNLRATFMPKLLQGQNGSGLHLHHMLWRGGKNVFHDPEARDEISETLRFFVGGLLRHAGGYCAITNPLVNSYKRLVPGHEAPVAVAWSLHNRAPLVRIPGRRGGDTRCEHLLPDPAANPYLALAVLLAAGLAGIRDEVNPGDPLNKNLDSLTPRERQRLKIEELPRDLADALDRLESDRVVRQALGEHIFSHYMEAKRAEWREYTARVHPWELQRYL